MKKRLFFRAVTLTLAFLLTLGTLGGCSPKQEVLMELEGKTFGANAYAFLLSRTKGNLDYAGYNVNSSTFWDTVVELDGGTTYGEYYKNRVLYEAKMFLAAEVLFDELKLTLPESEYEKIDQEIEDFIVGDADGSRSQLNSMLADYGFNIDMLRELYILEAKVAYLQDHLYGSEGEKIAANVKQDYLDNYSVAFKHILIRSFYYVYETDENGDDIYYLPKENNEKVNNIAYDTENGTTKLDELGKIITDKNESPIYYTADGKIAYDKKNGVRALKYDSGGDPITKKYSTEELAENKALAEEIVAGVESGDYGMFESYIAEYEASGLDAIITDNQMCFVYTTGNNSGGDVFNDIADKLVSMSNGDVAMLSSEYGYHVMMKYKMPDDAASDKEYSKELSDLVSRVANKLFEDKCFEKAKNITVNNEIFAKTPSMKEIAINHNY